MSLIPTVSAVSLAGEYQKISLTIKSLSPGGIELTLRDAQMPFSPIDGGIDQNVAVTKYPGTSKKTIHVMGASPTPTSFSGKWHYSLTPEMPNDLRKTFYDLSKSGQRVEVYWTAPASNVLEGAILGLPKEVIRRGIITSFHWKEHTWSEIDWTLSFEWDEDEILSTPLPYIPRSLPVGNLLSMINNIIKQFDAFVDGILDDINDIVDGCTGYLKMVETAVSDITDIAEGFASLPAETANKVLDGLNGIQSAFDEVAVSINSIATAYSSVGDTWNALVSDKTAFDFIYGDKDEADGADQVGKAAAVSVLKPQLDNIQYELEKQIRNCKQIVEASTIVDIYVVAKQGDSFQKWAVQYKIKNWLTIALANGLWDDNVIPGETYRIPTAARS